MIDGLEAHPTLLGREQFWRLDAAADDVAVPRLQSAEVQLQKSVKGLIRLERQPALGKAGGLGIEFRVRMRMGVAAAAETPQVAVEARADVQQLVGDRR